MYIKDEFNVFYNDQLIGYYNHYSNGKSSWYTAWGCPWDIEKELKELELDEEHSEVKPIKSLEKIIKDENRVKGRKQFIYAEGPIRMERKPQETGERFVVYKRDAKKGDPEYSELKHDAPHYEGPKTPEGMREWASWYAFNKMDDGTYEAELDEAWWWGGGHNDGGTIHVLLPEEIFELPYDEFLEEVVRYAAASHYGFTAEILKKKKGLKDFFGFKYKRQKKTA